MSGTGQRKLGDFISVQSGYAFDSACFSDVGTLPIVRIRDVVKGASSTYYSGPYDPKYLVRDGDLLVGMDGEFNRQRWRGGVAVLNQRVCRITVESPELSGAYLFHFLPRALKAIEDRTPFVTVKHLSADALRGVPIALPPIVEQRRIADTLDLADALRAKRRATLALLDSLTGAVFLEMFGDPVTNGRSWAFARFGDVLEVPLRNGLSPSTNGQVQAKVLSLAAITGGRFDARAWKVAPFRSTPPDDKSVDKNDFLICRGNGNKRLVGRGQFPSFSVSDITFPDTMIAARPKVALLEPAFLSQLWNSDAVRRQIEARARTTNGTFKINQEALEDVSIILPAREEQRRFGMRAAAIDRMRTALLSSSEKLDNLFASLQHQAFNGELVEPQRTTV